ncbi:hypothetical protein EDD85DRAFT_535215 [Armillaria nabsnona]|nr:hypothetical protein EDD85DRAFT_535215 [Armillaria nabsnona]
MSHTTEPLVPDAFLTAPRQAHPQFGEMVAGYLGGSHSKTWKKPTARSSTPCMKSSTRMIQARCTLVNGWPASSSGKKTLKWIHQQHPHAPTITSVLHEEFLVSSHSSNLPPSRLRPTTQPQRRYRTCGQHHCATSTSTRTNSENSDPAASHTQLPNNGRNT